MLWRIFYELCQGRDVNLYVVRSWITTLSHVTKGTLYKNLKNTNVFCSWQQMGFRIFHRNFFCLTKSL
jgi:hypothetical protein